MGKYYYYRDLRLDNGYVFYSRLTNSETLDNARMWNDIMNQAQDDLDIALNQLNMEGARNYAIADSIIAQGYAEQEKELAFLNKMFGVKNTKPIALKDYPKYITEINKFIGMKDQYANLLNLIQKGRAKETKENRRAATATAYFESYLSTAISDRIDFFFSSIPNKEYINMDKDLFESKLRAAMEEGIKDAVDKISKQVDEIDGQKVQIWEAARNILEMTDDQLEHFNSEIFKRYNLDKVLKEALKWQDTEKRKRSGRRKKGEETFKSSLRKAMDVSSLKARTINGFIDEFFSTFANGEVSKTGVKFNRAVVKSNIAKTDAISFFSMNGTFKIDNTLQEMNLAMKDSQSLIDAEKILSNFQKDMNKKDGSFVIYENAKAYTIGDNFRAFGGGGGEMKLSALPKYLDAMGSKIDGVQLINVLNNTISGAIWEDSATSVKESLSARLSEHMANFLFDDWESIGVSSNNAIHMFTLDQVKVPLSYLLIATGEAMKNMSDNPTNYFKVNFNYKKSILYPEPIKLKGNESLVKYWNSQRDEIRADGTFRVIFLRNFKSLIKSLLSTVQ